MTRKQALDKLEQLKKDTDHETAHAEADQVLLQFLVAQGHKDIALAWEAIMPKWYA